VTGQHPHARERAASTATTERALVIAMQYKREDVAGWLRRWGYPQLADEALRVLPDPVDVDQLEAWGMRHGLSLDEVISQMGGSP